MKEINLEGISWLTFIDGSKDWYCGRTLPAGDLYEAEELAAENRLLSGDVLKLVHWPDGTVYTPLNRQTGVCFGNAVYQDGEIYLLSVDFPGRIIRIHAFDCSVNIVRTAAEIPLDSIEDCYNLCLLASPVTLCRSGKDNRVDIIWPERSSFTVESHESLFLREGDRLYFNRWLEDPDYREETIVRNVRTGEIMEQLPGDIQVMPDGTLWHIC